MLQKRKRFTRVVIPVILILCIIPGIFMVKADWTFTIKEHLLSGRQQVSMTEIPADSLDLSKYSVQKLKKMDNVRFDQSLMLINKDYKIDSDFEADVSGYKDTGVSMNDCAASSFEAMADDVKRKYGKDLLISSAYRSRDQQDAVYADAKYHDEAAKVDESEHQAGLALDLYVPEYAGSAFIKTPAGQYVNSKGFEYGFILRYPPFKTSITGIPYEPWHLRYVGQPHATYIYNNKLTLEEYITSLVPGSFYECREYIISRQPKGKLLIPNGSYEIEISDDNTGHYIITAKKISAA